MRLRLTLVSLLVFAVGVVPAAARTEKAVVVEFRTPSGNIGCVFSSGLAGAEAPSVRCDVRSRLRPEPKRPSSCPLDYGDSVQIGRRSGHATLVCHGDTAIDPHARVLAYGHQFRRGGITCVSQSVGLTCTNERGHGYFLSRQSWRLF